MHEATVTITKKYPPEEGKKMWKFLTAEGLKLQAFPKDADLYSEGQRVSLNYTTSDFQGKSYHTIKGGPKSEPATAPSQPANGSGPEKGMIIKEAVQLLAAGKAPQQIIDWFVMAEEIYQHIKAPKVAPAFSDNLDDTF